MVSPQLHYNFIELHVICLDILGSFLFFELGSWGLFPACGTNTGWMECLCLQKLAIKVRGKITEEGKKGIQEGSEMISSMLLGSNFYFLVTETIIK